jgi:hypothetical protein
MTAMMMWLWLAATGERGGLSLCVETDDRPTPLWPCRSTIPRSINVRRLKPHGRFRHEEEYIFSKCREPEWQPAVRSSMNALLPGGRVTLPPSPSPGLTRKSASYIDEAAGGFGWRFDTHFAPWD